MFTTTELYINSIDGFKEKFGINPVKISFAPGRINLIGEHTDYTGGVSIPAAINRWISSAYRKENGTEWTIYGKNVDDLWHFDINEIENAEISVSSWRKYVQGAIVLFKREYGLAAGCKLYLAGNVPLEKGVSSSAALEMSILNALRDISGQDISDRALVMLAQQIEHQFLNVNSGLLDQFASQLSRHGKFQLVDFNTLDNEYITADSSYDNYSWVLMDTMIERKLAESGYQRRVVECREILNLLEEKLNISSFRSSTMDDIDSILPDKESVLYRRAFHIISENSRTMMAKKHLESGDQKALGALLNETHLSLSKRYEVSCDAADFIQEVGVSFEGCLGGRIMGGGFGGGVLFLVSKDSQEEFNRFIQSKYLEHSGIDSTPITFDLVGGAKVCQIN